MAIAFAHVSVHTRSKGHSAVAASSYRTSTKLFDARTGITHDFSNRSDVVFSAILLPEGSAPKFENREFLWNQVELAEKRKDAQVCKDIVLALPKELDLIQQIELTKRKRSGKYGLNYLLGIKNIREEHFILFVCSARTDIFKNGF